MGIYRFILALLVVVSHVWGRENTFGYNVGVVAVISFFILSGYVMTALIGKYYMKPAKLPYFYLDRFYRIYPQFFVYIVLTVVLVVVNKPTDQFFLTNVTPVGVVLNFLLLPLGFDAFLPPLQGCFLMPPAWSLGLEMSFYAAIPFILIFRVRTHAYLLSCAIFGAALLGLLNTELFIYRLLPGTLFIFLIGSFIYEQRQSKWPPASVVATFIALAITYFLDCLFLLKEEGLRREVMLGALVGICMVWLLRKQRHSKIDDFFGNLSYGIFVNHFFITWLLQKWNIQSFEFRDMLEPILYKTLSLPNGLVNALFADNGLRKLEVLLIFSCSILFSYGTFRCFEQPFIATRRKLRDKLPTRAA